MISSNELAGKGKPNAVSFLETRPKAEAPRLMMESQKPAITSVPSACSAAHRMNSSRKLSCSFGNCRVSPILNSLLEKTRRLGQSDPQ